MATNKDICRLIEKVDGKLGKCGKDYDVYLDEELKEWVVDLHDSKHHLKTFVNEKDVDSCVIGENCLSLGLQTGQLRYNFQKYLKEHAFY